MQLLLETAKYFLETSSIEFLQAANELTPLILPHFTAVCPMDDSNPLVSFGYHTQINFPNVSQTSSNQQVGSTRWVGDMTSIQMKASAFLVREEGFNAKAFAIPGTGFLSQSHIGDQINRLLAVSTPSDDNQNRTISIATSGKERQSPGCK
jgi:hypothetical protein